MKLKFGISSILGLGAALAALPTRANVQQAVADGIAAARLAPAAKYVVATMADLAALVANPGDIVTVVNGESGGREVREVVAIDADRFVTDSIVIERERSIEVPATETVTVGEGGGLPLAYAPTFGRASIANFGHVLHIDAGTGENSLYPVAEVEGGFAVDADLAGQEVVIQYSHRETLAVSEATVHVTQA